MFDKKTIFALYHIYDTIIDDIISRESKRIGFFDTKKQCIDVIERYKNFNGFKDHSVACFKILEYQIGQEYWRDEFLS